MGIFSHMFAGGAAGGAKAWGEVADENIKAKERRSMLLAQEGSSKRRAKYAQGLSDTSTEKTDIRRAKTAKDAAAVELAGRENLLGDRLTGAEDAAKAAGGREYAYLNEETGEEISRSTYDALKDSKIKAKFKSKDAINAEISRATLKTRGAKGGGKGVKEANDYGQSLVTEYKGKEIPGDELALWNEMRAAAGQSPVTSKMIKDKIWPASNVYGLTFGDEGKAAQSDEELADSIISQSQIPAHEKQARTIAKRPQNESKFIDAVKSSGLSTSQWKELFKESTGADNQKTKLGKKAAWLLKIHKITSDRAFTLLDEL